MQTACPGEMSDISLLNIEWQIQKVQLQGVYKHWGGPKENRNFWGDSHMAKFRFLLTTLMPSPHLRVPKFMWWRHVILFRVPFLQFVHDIPTRNRTSVTIVGKHTIDFNTSPVNKMGHMSWHFTLSIPKVFVINIADMSQRISKSIQCSPSPRPLIWIHLIPTTQYFLIYIYSMHRSSGKHSLHSHFLLPFFFFYFLYLGIENTSLFPWKESCISVWSFWLIWQYSINFFRLHRIDPKKLPYIDTFCISKIICLINYVTAMTWLKLFGFDSSQEVKSRIYGAPNLST